MIKYRKGYKYQLAETFRIETPIYPEKEVDSDYILLDTDGYLTIRKGYAWDGASGPTFNTKNSMEPSLIHDAFCQLIREDYLPESVRKKADIFFHRLLLRNKMWKPRAWLWLRGVRIGAKHNLQVPATIFIALFLSSCGHVTVTKTDDNWTMTSWTLFKNLESVEVDVNDQVKASIGSSSNESRALACALAPELCK